MAKPWFTSSDLIEAIKRKISFPISQVTFTEDDLLAFANEEMMISQVPSVLSYHEEYFVTTLTVPLLARQNKYPIPERAIGMKLRDIFWSDQSGNLFEMTRINSEDRAFFQQNLGATQAIHKFYLEGNNVVLTPSLIDNPTGSLVFVYFLRPNQLVTNDQAAIINYFTETLTVDNTNIVAGDTITIEDQIFTAVSGSPSANEFQIGGTSIATANNIVTAINTNGILIANNGSPSTAVISLKYTDLSFEISTSNSLGLSILETQGIEFDQIPSRFTDGALVDFLQTRPGHKTRAIDIKIPVGAISTNSIEFIPDTVPEDLVIGDYVCLANECIIPQIPSDLHTGLAERTCARILASLGDKQGLDDSNAKIAEIESRQGTLLDNRVEGAPQKITARHSLLRFNKMGVRRRF